MGLKFNNIKPLHNEKSFSYKEEFKTATLKKINKTKSKPIQNLTTRSKKVLKKLGYKIRQNARK